jgi:hypothetical protein
VNAAPAGRATAAVFGLIDFLTGAVAGQHEGAAQ